MFPSCALLSKAALTFYYFKMVDRSSILLLAAVLFASLPVNADGLYTKKSPVLQVDAKNYDSLIARSNHTSVSSPQYRARLTTDRNFRCSSKVMGSIPSPTDTHNATGFMPLGAVIVRT